MPAYRSCRPAARVGGTAVAVAISVTAFTASSATAATATAAATASAATATAATAGAATGGWRTVPGPAIAAGASANLTAVAMASPSRGWAAGFTLASQNAPFEPLLAAWNGRRWRAIGVRLGRGVGGRLDGLAAVSAANAWAVGTAYPSRSTAQPLILHWNGRRWARSPAAPVPGFGYVELLGVAAHGAADAWAVGEAQSATSLELRPVIEHWNGRRWRLAADPKVPPMTALSSVTVAADGQAWAVGTPFTDTGRAVILHWIRHAWVTSATPRTGGAVFMNGVTAVSPGNVWAVGSDSAAGGPFRPCALHWNGRRWTLVTVAHPGEKDASWEFESVTSAGRGRLVAVGSDTAAGPGIPGRALYGGWNGRRWSLSTGPHITQLNAVSFDGGRAIWAVGSQTISSQSFRPVVQVSG
jgi:hypothetical protein